jgi:hypothetical protein
MVRLSCTKMERVGYVPAHNEAGRTQLTSPELCAVGSTILTGTSHTAAGPRFLGARVLVEHRTTKSCWAGYVRLRQTHSIAHAQLGSRRCAALLKLTGWLVVVFVAVAGARNDSALQQRLAECGEPHGRVRVGWRYIPFVTGTCSPRYSARGQSILCTSPETT